MIKSIFSILTSIIFVSIQAMEKSMVRPHLYGHTESKLLAALERKDINAVKKMINDNEIAPVDVVLVLSDKKKVYGLLGEVIQTLSEAQTKQLLKDLEEEKKDYESEKEITSKGFDPLFVDGNCPMINEPKAARWEFLKVKVNERTMYYQRLIGFPGPLAELIAADHNARIEEKLTNIETAIAQTNEKRFQ